MYSIQSTAFRFPLFLTDLHFLVFYLIVQHNISFLTCIDFLSNFRLINGKVCSIRRVLQLSNVLKRKVLEIDNRKPKEILYFLEFLAIIKFFEENSVFCFPMSRSRDEFIVIFRRTKLRILEVKVVHGGILFIDFSLLLFEEKEIGKLEQLGK